MEERFYVSKLESKQLVTSTPRLTGNYAMTGVFSGWRPVPVTSKPRHSILILDGSGSMDSSYADLIVAANAYIDIQAKAGGLISVVWFASDAGIIYERETRQLTPMEGYTCGGTSFSAALKAAIPIIQRNPANYECRILFFTDGYGGSATDEVAQVQRLGVRLDAVGVGGSEQNVLRQLVTCGGTVTIGQTMNDVQQVFVRIAAT
jgi:uncharacterized protein with von Willebrand factor type A (vWA) domain